jgi:hypothetical protein
LVLKRCHRELDHLVEAITDVDQWVAKNHDALLLG